MSDAQIEAELKKCRLLCVTCHKQVRCDLLYNTPVHAPYRGAFSCSSLRSRSQPPVQPNQETLREKGREHDLKVRALRWPEHLPRPSTNLGGAGGGGGGGRASGGGGSSGSDSGSDDGGGGSDDGSADDSDDGGGESGSLGGGGGSGSVGGGGGGGDGGGGGGAPPGGGDSVLGASTPFDAESPQTDANMVRLPGGGLTLSLTPTPTLTCV